ncbi:beta-N-acetylhexosaminidase [Formosa sp. S-31]|uniref:beta-N-acetylhexosaminidase n=1 Tax=Formosa sp. S-31 TaxID=2790949 RepID=UPI003EBFF36B
MKHFFIFIFSLVALSCWSQNISEAFNLMPWPKNITQNNQPFILNEAFTVSLDGPDSERLKSTSVNFLRRLSGRTGIFLKAGFPVSAKQNKTAALKISYNDIASLNINTIEAYILEVSPDQISIKAQTDIGALRGLETVLQLIDFNESTYFIPGVSITDEPRFVWRGLMIDVSRHFHPVHVIKRNLDAMAAVKMNVFHWHLVDDQGFRIQSKVYPQLTKLASDGLFYTQEQIRDVVNYASNLGIRVIPEIDVPGHASAILTAFPNLGSKSGYEYSVERNSGVFDPTLDPTNDDTYVFLEKLFTEIVTLFPDDYFHIGGDENEGRHWDENKDIQKFKKEHNLKTNHDLQTYFNIKVEKILNKLGKKLVGWDEILTPNMPTTAVIHSWRGENEGLPKGGTLIEAAKKGYNTILSNGFYIDRMESIEKHYLTEPIGNVSLTEAERSRILGGEATMWSELTTPLTIDSRIWPRTIAIAERLWSDKSVNDVASMLKRIASVSFRLEELGITHIKNRDVILRNMSNNQDISSLITLQQICEPLKIYARNKDGIEYQTYSPFTLFADACVVDALDAVHFNALVRMQQTKPSQENQAKIKNYLEKWSKNHEQFLKLTPSPILTELTPLSKNLSEASSILLEKLNQNKISSASQEQLDKNLKVLKQDHVDVEVAIIQALETLAH